SAEALRHPKATHPRATSPKGAPPKSNTTQSSATQKQLKVVVPRGGHLVKPNRGTATALPTRPAGERTMLAGRRGVTSHRGVRPCSYPDRRRRFRRRLQPYGMQTVHPYVGAVKIVALHIVD